MGNQQFLIPANSKKSMLILGYFNMTDLIIFGSGIIITFVMLMTIHSDSLTSSIIILLPVLITGFMVFPIPNQHNVRTLISNIFYYYTKRRTFYWKGWCNSYVETKSK